jgi:hypothetical protein
MHAMLVRRPSYDRGKVLLKSSRAYTQWVEDTVALPAATPPDIPPRARHAMTGSAFIKSVTLLSRDEREAAIRRELFAGNIPSFLRNLRTVEVTDTTTDSVKHTVSYDVMPDYLAIGSDRDFVRIPMTPLTVERESPLTFLQHHRIIEDQLRGVERGTFVAGIKKDVVVTNRLGEKPQRVAIYGWHYVNGQPIQPLYVGHVDWYVDYSHGIRPVRRVMRVDGVQSSFEKTVSDPELNGLISDEGVITVSRYEK